jgi:hypothetical protein
MAGAPGVAALIDAPSDQIAAVVFVIAGLLAQMVLALTFGLALGHLLLASSSASCGDDCQ